VTASGRDNATADQLAHLERDLAHYRELVEHTSDWLWEVDAVGRYTYASSRVSVLLAYEAEEVVGRTPFEFMPPAEAT
jgi:PAS domain S-box-containing protein